MLKAPAAKRLTLDVLRIPPAASGLKVGLYGGSFNPPHEAHRHVALTALKRLGLDWVWWLVSPGNPLKDPDQLAELDQRVRAVRRVARHPRFAVTAFEAAEGLVYTADSIAHLQSRRSGVKFVWIAGADSLAGFHHWKNWQRIFEAVPVAFVDRPDFSLAPISSTAGQVFSAARVDESDASRLADSDAPAWVFLHAPLNPLSSTQLRNAETGRNS